MTLVYDKTSSSRVKPSYVEWSVCMGLSVVRFEREGNVNWGVVKNQQIYVLKGDYNTLSCFLNTGVDEAKSVYETEDAAIVSFDTVRVLSPVTKPARVVCQGVNYASHREEAGLEVQRPSFNLFFTKADSSLCGAYDDIVRPRHVQLLDYEVELGLVIGKEISGAIEVTAENLHEFVAAFVIVNDVSARDVQLPQGQWWKGKSYRTFGPTGPLLYLLHREEAREVHNLDVKLWVNDELRQSANTGQLLYKPEETLTELSEMMDLSVGDLVVTGTPGGVALHLTKEVMDQIMNPFFPGDKKMTLLMESQQKLPNYLKDGDVIRCEISSPDGSISLGQQISRVVSQD